MKTVIKLGSSRSSIPVLNMIAVDENFIRSTDMDVWLSMPNTRKVDPGMYHARGFDLLPVKTPVPVSDWPDYTENMGRPVAQLLLTEADLKALAWARLASSTEEVRYYLNGLCFAQNEVACTDGHRANLYKLGERAGWLAPDVNYILPNRGWDILAAALAEMKIKEVTLNMYQKGFLFVAPQFSLWSKIVDGTFPPYDRIIPAKTKFSSPFDPAETKKLLPTITSLYKIVHSGDGRPNSVPVKMCPDGYLEINYVEVPRQRWKISTSSQVPIGFNARYLSQACKGTMYFADRDAAAPVLIDGGDRLSVVMPLRV